MSRLTSNVNVDGVWYGPSYTDAGNPPAGKVTNPAAYEDGQVPKGSAAQDDTGKAPTIERTAHDAEGVTREGPATRGRPAKAGRR